MFDSEIYHACVEPELVEACGVYGDGYCPEVSCEPADSTESYDEDECTASYCICTDVWEETVILKKSVLFII